MKKSIHNEDELKRRKRRKKKKKTANIPMVIVCALVMVIQIAAGLFLCKEIAGMNMLPGKYLWLIVGVVWFMALVQVVLVLQKKAASYLLSAMLGLSFASLVALGVVYVRKTEETLDIITKTKVHTTLDQVSIAVKKDTPYEDLEDLKGLKFGVQASVDRTNTDKTMESVQQLLSGQLTVHEYDGVYDMVEAFYAGDDDVIVFNEAYRTLIEDKDEDEEHGLYEDFSKDIRVVNTYTFASSVVVDEEEETRKSSFDSNGNVVYETEEDSFEYLPGSIDPSEVVIQEPFILYLSGIDTFGDISTKSRSDVNILAVVNQSTQQILLVTTPRDYYVPLAIKNKPLDKLTHAGIYGIECSIETLENLYNIDINYYLRVNFSGFINIVDALGGVDVMSDYDFTGEAGGYSYVTGKNHVNGKQALCFVRERHVFKEGDIQRAKNQMAMIRAIVSKATSPVILAKYNGLMDSVSKAFMTTMPKSMIEEIVKAQLANEYNWDVQTYSTQGEGARKKTYSMGKRKLWVSLTNQKSIDRATELINQVLAGEKIDLKKGETESKAAQ